LRYGKLLEDLENDFVQGTADNYPDTVQHAYMLLVHWKQDPKNVICLIGGIGDSLSFANLGRQSGTQKEVTCYRCKKKGHVVRNCPEGKEDEAGGEDESEDMMATQLLLQGIEELAVEDLYQFAHVDRWLPATWILLDNQSTVNIFYNRKLLRDVCETNRYMCVQCNAGWMVTNMIGHLPGYLGEVWYNPDGIANILLMGDAEKHFRIRYDSGAEKAFLVKKPNGTVKRFVKNPGGLYYLDIAAEPITAENETTLVMTVADKQSKYTVRGY
jgi:Zinc knuckle